MPVKILPFHLPIFDFEFVQVFGESLDLGGLHEADDFEMMAHEVVGVVGESGDHGLADVVGVIWVEDVPEKRRFCGAVHVF